MISAYTTMSQNLGYLIHLQSRRIGKVFKHVSFYFLSMIHIWTSQSIHFGIVGPGDGMMYASLHCFQGRIPVAMEMFMTIIYRNV